MRIEWIDSSKTLLRIGDRVINLAMVTQIALKEEMDFDEDDYPEGNLPQVTFYFGVPVGSTLGPDVE